MRIRQLCRNNLLIEPKFEEVGNFFKVTLFRPRLSLPEEIQAVFDLLKEQGTMGSKEISKYLEIHQNTALKRLRWLEQKGLVHRQGRGTKVRYLV
ncbi:MAG: MarR family transcriptional regulator [Deltaproteobacteria bacterium]|nr:MarR family transcriptional regulator [Deltaproteobacteria bacterium]